MKINGLFNNPSTLYEHLGSLDAIDKELTKGFIKLVKTTNQITGIGWGKKPGDSSWDDGRARTTTSLPNVIGRNSTLEDKQLSVVEAVDALTTNLNVAGLVYKLNGKQVMIIMHDRFIDSASKQAGYKEVNTYTWAMTAQFARNISATSTLKYPPSTSKKTISSEILAALKHDPNKGIGTLLASQLAPLFVALAMGEWLKENPTAKSMPKANALPKLEFIEIGPDKSRSELRGARNAARKGFVPVPKTARHQVFPNAKYMDTSHNVYVRELFNNLKFRLNQHKNKKAGAFETTEAMLKHFIDEGYLKKLNYMGATYNLKDNRIDFSDLMLGKNSRGGSYIEYEAETRPSWNDPRHKAVNAEFSELRQAMIAHAPAPPSFIAQRLDAAETDEQRAEIINKWHEEWSFDAAKPKMASLYLKHKIEPSKILVKLKLEGGKIVPHDIEMKFERF